MQAIKPLPYKLFLHCVVLILLCSVIAACDKSSDASIRFGLSNMPVKLDPRFATDAASYRVSRLLYQSLVDFDDSKKVIPAIASWEQLSPMRFRFVLNESVRDFHNGTALTSADVKSTYESVLDKDNASPHRASLTLIDKIQTPNAKTIDFTLNRADPLFPSYLVIGILPKNLMDNNQDFNRNPIGSGVYRFVDWPEDGILNIQRVQDKQLVRFIHVPNPTVRVLKLMRGEIDMLQNDLPPELINFLAKKDAITIQKQQGTNFAYLGFNLENKTTRDIAIRKAIAHGIDRDEIIKYVFGQSARKANALLPPDHWAGNNKLVAYEYDVGKAKQLLAKAGYQKNSITLTYKTSNDPFRIRVATILQAQLAKIGIKVKIMSFDWGTFYGDIKNGRFQLYSLAWIGIKTPDIFRYAFHSQAMPPNGANRGRFNDPVVDELIERAEKQTSYQQQAIYYSQLQAELLAKLPYIPLWYEDHFFISYDNIKNYTLPADGNYDGLITVEKLL